MFSSMNYERIMARMLTAVREAEPEIDVREGSLIFTALAPLAAEIMSMYVEFERLLNETFADTQSEPYLRRRAAERGIIQKPDETVEQLRRRVLQSLEAIAFGGNIADYVQKVGAISGVGSVKVTPVWDGGGTVLITVTDGNLQPPGAETVLVVQEAVDPFPGEGRGIAPIGHKVTVRGAEEVEIDIGVSIILRQGFSLEDRRHLIERAIADYFEELRGEWADEIVTIVRQSAIEQRILSVPGILDIFNTRIGGREGNMALSPHQLPMKGELQLA